MSNEWVMVPRDPTEAMFSASSFQEWDTFEQEWRAMLDAAPQRAEPVAQIGWADEFGNLFPMAAWKPAQRTHHDAHKTAWRPVFLHPPAAEVQRLREALEYLIEKCGESDDAQYGTLGTKFVRNIARRALEGK